MAPTGGVTSGGSSQQVSGSGQQILAPLEQYFVWSLPSYYPTQQQEQSKSYYLRLRPTPVMLDVGGAAFSLPGSRRFFAAAPPATSLVPPHPSYFDVTRQAVTPPLPPPQNQTSSETMSPPRGPAGDAVLQVTLNNERPSFTSTKNGQEPPPTKPRLMSAPLHPDTAKHLLGSKFFSWKEKQRHAQVLEDDDFSQIFLTLMNSKEQQARNLAKKQSEIADSGAGQQTPQEQSQLSLAASLEAFTNNRSRTAATRGERHASRLLNQPPSSYNNVPRSASTSAVNSVKVRTVASALIKMNDAVLASNSYNVNRNNSNQAGSNQQNLFYLAPAGQQQSLTIVPSQLPRNLTAPPAENVTVAATTVVPQMVSNNSGGGGGAGHASAVNRPWRTRAGLGYLSSPVIGGTPNTSALNSSRGAPPISYVNITNQLSPIATYVNTDEYLYYQQNFSHTIQQKPKSTTSIISDHKSPLAYQDYRRGSGRRSLPVSRQNNQTPTGRYRMVPPSAPGLPVPVVTDANYTVGNQQKPSISSTEDESDSNTFLLSMPSPYRAQSAYKTKPPLKSTAAIVQLHQQQFLNNVTKIQKLATNQTQQSNRRHFIVPPDTNLLFPPGEPSSARTQSTDRIAVIPQRPNSVVSGYSDLLSDDDDTDLMKCGDIISKHMNTTAQQTTTVVDNGKNVNDNEDKAAQEKNAANVNSAQRKQEAALVKTNKTNRKPTDHITFSIGHL